MENNDLKEYEELIEYAWLNFKLTEVEVKMAILKLKKVYGKKEIKNLMISFLYGLANNSILYWSELMTEIGEGEQIKYKTP